VTQPYHLTPPAPEPKRPRRAPRGKVRLVTSKPISSQQSQLAEPAYERQLPRTYGECRDQKEPCPFVSCRHHLLLDDAGVRVSRAGGKRRLVSFIKYNVATGLPPNKPIDSIDGDELLAALCRMPFTCSLRAAEHGGMTLDDVGDACGYTRERSRQVEGKALHKLSRHQNLEVIRDQYAEATAEQGGWPEHGEEQET
jgi:hypothetical protein